MGVVVRLIPLVVCILARTCTAQNYSGEDFLDAIQAVIREQKRLQQLLESQLAREAIVADSISAFQETFAELKSNQQLIAETVFSVMDILGELKNRQDIIESGVNDTLQLLKDAATNTTQEHVEEPKETNSTNICLTEDTQNNTVILLDRALGKPTLPLTQWATLTSARVVDGNVVTQYHSIDKGRPWWSVDLGESFLIKTIDILPHPCVPDWYRSIKVFVGNKKVTDGNFDSYTVVAEYTGPWDAKDRLVYNFYQELHGRYVAIQGFSGNHYLALMDVKVMA